MGGSTSLRPRPLWCALLLFCLLLASTAGHAALADTDTPEPYGPWSLFADYAASCAQTLDHVDAGTALQATGLGNIPIIAFQGAVVLCPTHCLNSTSPPPPVYGSFPYHGRSSACLAAIHAGIINATEGGGVFVTRFHRHDWSNSSTQTIFPHTSAHGTLSNGVESRDVDSAWYSVPSNASEWSFAVRGRGDYVVQRRTAPFPPRSGHLQLFQRRVGHGFEAGVHTVMGGYNGSHYLNDVWLAVQYVDTTTPDLEWTRLPDAPWSPRADMQVRVESSSTPLMVLGGQSGHRCGLRELGVCNSDAWRLQVDLDPDSRVVSSYWVASNFTLPLPSRCAPAVLVAANPSWDREAPEGFLVIGGQLSYDDPTCSSPPVTVNDVWMQVTRRFDGEPLSQWTRQTAAPFSPRRFGPGASCHTEPELYVTQHCTTSGGLRYTNVTRVGEGVARLTGAELSADIWRCALDTQQWSCNPWTTSGEANATADDWWESLPLPTAGGVDAVAQYWPGYANAQADAVAFGGWHALSSLHQWQRTPPRIADDAVPELVDDSFILANVSCVVNPYNWEYYPATYEQRMDGRAQLPMNASMDEAELNDPSGIYALGSPWSSMAGVTSAAQMVWPMHTFHLQPWSLALTPLDASWHCPQAASSLNTSRPQHRFSLRRHSHRSAAWPVLPRFWGLPSMQMQTSYLSGGQSGSTFHNDWMSIMRARCLPPTDPSFLQALGPMRIVPRNGALSKAVFEWNAFATYGQVRLVEYKLLVSCAEGSHFEPPSMDSERWLTCAPNGMWLDEEILSIRRCMPDRLRCKYPLTDLGGTQCEPLLPVMMELRGTYQLDPAQPERPIPSLDRLTLIDVPLISGVRLSIYGNAFLTPLRVTVNSQDCANPTLIDTPDVPVGVVQYNLTYNGTSTPLPVTSEYGALIVCTLPALTGKSMVVQVTSGVMNAFCDVDLSSINRQATLTSLSPVLTSISSSSCQQTLPNYPLELYDCPARRPFFVDICLSVESAGNDPLVTSQLQPMLITSFVQTHMPCSEFTPAGWSQCTTCLMQPYLSSQELQVWRGFSILVVLISSQSGYLRFEQCPAGTRQDYSAAAAGNFTNLCSDCAPGSSTDGVQGATECPPCPAGFFAAGSASEMCQPCEAGTFAAYGGRVTCEQCPVNSYTNYSAQTRCDVCDLDQYIVYDAGSSGRVAAQCRACPSMAVCEAKGVISADAGSYLLVDQQHGTLSAILCSSLSCIGGDVCPTHGPRQQVDRSQLTVRNCCGAGRWPAYIGNGSQLFDSSSLAASGGYNVLCATCLPGYASVSGRCVPCTSVNYPALFGVVLLAFVLVYLVHRLPHDWSGSATLMVSSNFLQLSALFLASESLPALLSLVNLNLLADHITRGEQPSAAVEGAVSPMCIVPLDVQQRLLLTLVSPAVAFCLLDLLWLLQLAAHRCLIKGCRSSEGEWGERHPYLQRAYLWLFEPSSSRVPLWLRRSPLRPALVVTDGGLDAAHHRVQPLLPRVDDDGAGVEEDDEVEEVRPSVWLLYLRSSVRLLLMSYTGLTVLTLSFFHLQHVGDFGYRVVDYPALAYDSPQYNALAPVMLILLVTVVGGFPVVLTAFLVAARCKPPIPALYQPLQEDGVVEAQSPANAAMQGGQASLLQQMSAAVLVQLTLPFRPSCWWMAPFLLLRRLLLVSLLTWVRSSRVWSWLTLSSFCLLALHVQLQPYKRQRDNRLETATLLSLGVQCSLLSMYPPPFLSAALVGVFNVLVLGPMLSILAVLGARAWSVWRERSRRGEAERQRQLHEEDTL